MGVVWFNGKVHTRRLLIYFDTFFRDLKQSKKISFFYDVETCHEKSQREIVKTKDCANTK